MSELREKWDDLTARAGLSRVSPRVALVVAFAALLACGWGFAHRASGGSAEFNYVAAGEAEGAAASDGTAGSDEGDGKAGADEASTADTSAETSVVVHVAGAVMHPGIVRLAVGSRVADAVEGAGGALGDAALDAVNLARVLADGEQIYLPTRDEVASGIVSSSEVAPGTVANTAAGSSGASSSESGCVNINTADATTLDTLPGVGPSTAEKIIADRETNGPFASAEDLMRVSGIGEKRFEQLRDLITVK